jgi:hypothetical protein
MTKNMQASTLFCKLFWWTVWQPANTNIPAKNGTASNMGFGVIGAGRTNHQLFVRYAASVPADEHRRTLVLIINF